MRALIPFDLVLESRALNPVGGVECAGCSRGGTCCIRDHSDLLDVYSHFCAVSHCRSTTVSPCILAQARKKICGSHRGLVPLKRILCIYSCSACFPIFFGKQDAVHPSAAFFHFEKCLIFSQS